MSSQTFKCGLVALAGLPNAGKSTLLNALLGEKVSITSGKPQTTRNAIHGIKTTDSHQIIFVDTPGYHAGRGKLNRAMVQQAEEVILSVDLVCILADPTERGGAMFQGLLDKAKESGAPMILVLTKADNRSKEDLYKAAERLSKMADFKEIIPTSAKQRLNLEKLEELIAAELPEAQAVYDSEEITTQPEHFLIAEFIREQAFEMLQQEVPYDILVETEKVEDTADGKMNIIASIIVSRDSQKGIVIGKGATMLKEIGTKARKDLEKFFGVKVRLDLTVKVREDWATKDEYLRIQGL
ncbi:MAG: GTPase Era [Deferribacteraceae bacterium]|jgi:GTP-binding protein Era|nr:GTPase Era [Deferribacteraceae bacterium]